MGESIADIDPDFASFANFINCPLGHKTWPVPLGDARAIMLQPHIVSPRVWDV